MGRLLNQIKEPNDIKRISPKLYPVLAEEIRDFLLNNVSQTGGHLASNLGAVEITMALHICLRFPEDKVVYDVGHQSYVHKILTGRKDEFSTLRQKDGLCGFPKRSESECDVFGTGHSSTSISAALGLAVARDLEQKDNTVVAVIGDGALSGGMAYEALNNLSILRKEKKNMIIILNDNKMSISENVGGMSRYLNDLRSRKSYSEFKENVESALNNIPGVGKSVARTLKKSKDSIKQLFIPGMLFENMGITYYGLVNGHDIYELIHAINRAKQHEGPILIHAITRKGMGYKNAEKNPEKFHGIGPFDRESGELLAKKTKKTYTDVFADSLVALAKNNKKIVAITAAMPSGTGLKSFKKYYPKRFFDVGIAEEHAVTFAAGLAAQGMHPVFAVYSSFLQRGYDQVLHDVCIQKLPVFFCIDRSGLVGADGETHQGIFDISYLGHIPNMVLMAPKNGREMPEMMKFALHIVNVELDEDNMDHIFQVTKVIQEIMTIVKYHFHAEFDTSNVYYYRFITHLKFFALRLLKDNQFNEDEENELLDVVKDKYCTSYECVLKIKDFLEKKYNYTLQEDEIVYLTIHVHRVVHKTKGGMK